MKTAERPCLRYRFARFVVSPRQRLLLRDGEPQELIPRYFDLLVLLLSRRHEAVARQAILDAVWHDVVVSEGALNQAVRSLRRLLGDEPREPRYIRTVPRFGYQFVYSDVVEEAEVAEPERSEEPAGALERERDGTFDLLRRRAPAAIAGGALAGIFGGAVGALLLAIAGTPPEPVRLVIVFALVGAVIGGLGAAGVGTGILLAEAAVRRFKLAWLVAAGSLGGGLIGASAHLVASWTVEELFGHRLSAAGGGLEGLVLGAAVGLGYALAVSGDRVSWRVACVATPLLCALAAVLLTWAGRPLGGVSLDVIARAFDGSHAGLAPLARLFGEPQLGPATRVFVGFCEGILFGSGMAWGLSSVR